MDKNAFYKLSYGVFMLSTKSGEKANGCITNTCIQVANSPTRVAISVLNSNYTCDLIKESKVFALSLLDESVTFETIKYWGFQSGHDVNKMEPMPLPTDVNGVPYLSWQTCAVISCTVVDSIDLGSHTLFIAQVDDAISLSDNNPLTYAYYQDVIKPKPQAKASEDKKEKKIIGWRCRICDYVYEGPELPDDFICPICGHERSDFEPIYG